MSGVAASASFAPASAVVSTVWMDGVRRLVAMARSAATRITVSIVPSTGCITAL